MVVLHGSTLSNGNRESGLGTGFLLADRGLLFWASAGHVVRRVRELIASDERAHLSLLDGYEARFGESIPLHRGLRTFVAEDDAGLADFDFGLVVLGPNEADLLACSKERAALGLNAIRLDWEPEGYLLGGYPDCWLKTQSQALGGGQSIYQVEASPAVLPIVPVPARDGGCMLSDEQIPFWGNPTAFYGEVLPYHEGGAQPAQLGGMSGAPLFGVGRAGGRIRYGFAGVQRGQLGRFVKCESTSRVREFLLS